jgi:hypothetical protein
VAGNLRSTAPDPHAEGKDAGCGEPTEAEVTSQVDGRGSKQPGEGRQFRVRFDMDESKEAVGLLRETPVAPVRGSDAKSTTLKELFGESASSGEESEPRYMSYSTVTDKRRAKQKRVATVAALWRQAATTSTKKDKEKAARAEATTRPGWSGQRFPRAGEAVTVVELPSDVLRTGEGAISVTTIEAQGGRDWSYGSVKEVRAAVKMARRRHRLQRAGRSMRKEETAITVPKEGERNARREQDAEEARLDVKRRRRFRQALGVERQVVEAPLRQKMDMTGAGEGAAAPVHVVEADDGLPTASMRIGGRCVQVKLDTGARYTVAGTDWMKLGDRQLGAPPVDVIEGIGGFQMDVIGVWRFELLNVFGQTVVVNACIIDGCTTEFLIGSDFLVHHKAEMDFNRHEVRYTDHQQQVVLPFKTFVHDGRARVYLARAASKMKLYSQQVAAIEVAVPAAEGEVGVFIPAARHGSRLLGATITVARGGKASVPLMNLDGSRLRLPAQEELGTWVPVGDDMEVLEATGGLSATSIELWVKKLSGSDEPLTDENAISVGVQSEREKELVLKLLRKYRTVLESKGDCPPAASCGVQHHIDTGDHAPILQKRRRHAQSEQIVIDANVKKMLDSGVIEEGDGAWGFPVVLVRKKDGEVRFCIDYRALNQVTRRDVYPLPRIDETLEALSGAKLFTTLDLKAGYWQVEMAEEDKDKTAFTTRQGLYRFVRMPFGLMNAPSTFQRMMNCVLRGLTWLTCLVYLDDIIIYTKGGIERHILELAVVLERLKEAGLSLKPKKCKFATTELEYLGHQLTPDGIRPLKRLVEAVQRYDAPKDVVELKRFVHLAGYYRRFVKGFGTVAAPMTKLLRKNVAWTWGEAQQRAFDELKRALTEKPVLLYPNFSKPFTVATDASQVGLGACLMQDHGGGPQPVAYASRVNDPTTAKYPIWELECLAVIWAIKLFRPYLYGRKFTVITDHKALTWLMKSPNLVPRLHRWALTLQEYNFDLTYNPGRTNVVADGLSRAPVGATAEQGGDRGRGDERDRGIERVGDDEQRGDDRGHEQGAQEEQERVSNDKGRGPSQTKDGVVGTVKAVTRSAARAVDQPAKAVVQGGGDAACSVPINSELNGATETNTVRGVTTMDSAAPDAGSHGEAAEPTSQEGWRAAAKRKMAATGVEAEDLTSGDGLPPLHPSRFPRASSTHGSRTRAKEGEDEGRGRTRRLQPAAFGELGTLQLTDQDIKDEQKRSKMVVRLLKEGEYRKMAVKEQYGLAVIETGRGSRVVLPPALWPVVFKESHDSIWAGHLRGPQTHARIAQLYWWPNMHREVNKWVAGCQECGSRKARPREVVPPLRSIRGGAVGDRWALDVAGPFPVAAGGERFVIAAVEYVTRYAVAKTVKTHKAEDIAQVLVEEVILKHGTIRELLTDNAPEMTGEVLDKLFEQLQMVQTNPVPYRPQMIGLVERFHRTWKDCVSLYMEHDKQRDWEMWVKFAVYAYNSAKHSTVGLSPNELMMGRRLRGPGELLRAAQVSEAGDLTQYHRSLLAHLESSHKIAAVATAREQARQARYYNRHVRIRRTFEPGDRVWMYHPPRDKALTKFVHQWLGPVEVVEPAGYDNYLVRRADQDGKVEEHIVHSSFMVSYHCPKSLLERETEDIQLQLQDEEWSALAYDAASSAATAGAATARISVAAAGASGAGQGAAGPAIAREEWRGKVVEVRRRRRRNLAGRYVLEYQVETVPKPGSQAEVRADRQGRKRRWIRAKEYELLWRNGSLVEETGEGEGV